jgi:hypothetical protein
MFLCNDRRKHLVSTIGMTRDWRFRDEVVPPEAPSGDDRPERYGIVVPIVPLAAVSFVVIELVSFASSILVEKPQMSNADRIVARTDENCETLGQRNERVPS